MRSILLPLLLGLAACNSDPGNVSVDGVTPEEAAQLDNAAAMLDASPDDLALPPENATPPAATGS